MKKLALGRSRLVWAFAIFLGSFGVVAPLFRHDDVFIVVYALATAGAVGAITAYFVRFVDSLILQETRSLTGGDTFIIATVTGCLFNAARFLWGFAYYGMDEPEIMRGNLWSAWFVWGLFLSMIFYMLSRGAPAGRIPLRNWVRTGIVIVIGVTGAGLVIMYTYLRK